MKRGEGSTIALVFGRKHCGKTSLFRKMIKKVRGHKSILVVDKLSKFVSDGFTVFSTAAGFLEYARENPRFEIALNTTNEAEIRAAICFAYGLGNVTIFYDEADSTFGSILDPDIRDVILRGRNQGIDLVLSALRPYKLGPDVRNQADIVYCFNVVNKEMTRSLVSEFGRPSMSAVIHALDYKGYEYLKIDLAANTTEVYTSKKNLPERTAAILAATA